jgi:hypothetical protein
MERERKGYEGDGGGEGGEGFEGCGGGGGKLTHLNLSDRRQK